jgi:uncharacterized membrane protein YedE/YeeE
MIGFVTGSAVFVGLALGVLFQKGRLCHASMLTDLFLFRTVSRNGAGILLATGVTMVLWSGSYFVRGAEGFWLPAWGGFSLVGGFVFGIGMVTASGCIMSTLYRAASGDLAYVVVLLSACLGYIGYGIVYPIALRRYFTPLWLGDGITLYAAPLPAPMVALLAIGVGTAGYVVLTGRNASQIRADGASNGASPARGDSALRTGSAAVLTGSRRYLEGLSLPDSPRRWVSRSWDPRTCGIGIAVVVAVWLWISQVWTVSGPESAWVALAADAVGVEMLGIDQWTAATLPTDGAVSPAMVVIACAFVGAWGSAAVSGEFEVRTPDRDALPHAAGGGLLMGIGASIAPACNVGNMFTGIAQLSVHGVVASAGIVAGAYVATRFLYV